MKIILLDGNSFCYRAFYAIRELRNSKGEPTNAVYGFITMLDKIVKDVNPEGVVMTFDMKGPTFRHKRYENYKIQRQPMPEDLVCQMPIIKEVVRAMNIPIYEMEGYEADDVIATLAKKAEKEGHEVFIVTGDKDALQLVNKKIKVLNPQKDNQIYDEDAVKLRFGVEPGRVVEIMALMGDASDNIPGVPGVGEKTAMKLIAEFGSLEGVLKNVKKVKGEKLQENLETYKDQARLSHELATIDMNVPIKVDFEKITRQEPDTGKLIRLYQALEFRTLLKNLPVENEKNEKDESLRYFLVDDEAGFKALKDKLSKKREWVFDFETTDPSPIKAEPIGISFCFTEKEAYYVSFGASGDLLAMMEAAPAKAGKSKLKAAVCLNALKSLFEDEKIKKIGQNLKYETIVLKKFGIELKGIHFDTMVASYCLNPAKPNHNLDDIAIEHLGIRITSITELIGKGKNQIGMAEADLEKVYRYGCQDSDVTFRLYPVLKAKLEEKDLMDLFEKMEMPLVPIIADMEFAGVAIDRQLLETFSKEMEKQLAALGKTICKIADCDFNINSPKQLAEILFEKLGLPVVKRTKTGASTDVEVLQELSEIHPLPKEILKFRELSKLKSTYVDALPLLVNPKTGRVHTSFNQTVTATGRFSSSDPNLQNIPVRTEEGRKIRRAFIAESRETTLISADYSQIELRVLAHLSEDENLIRAFKEGADIHRYTASLIFNVDLDSVEDGMRNSAKTVNFGVLYGMGAFSLAKNLKTTHEAAKDFIKAYFDRYPSVKQYLDSTIEKAKKDGFVSTVFKRRRYIPEILSKEMRTRSFAERTAINAPIQGTASDILKIAMTRIVEKFKKKNLGARMIMQVHDELVFEAPKKELDETVKIAVEEMRGAVSFLVPMDVSVKCGPNWLDMEELN